VHRRIFLVDRRPIALPFFTDLSTCPVTEPDPLVECVPADLRGPATTITTIAGGLSGAGVHRVDANGRTFVLKISKRDESIDAWRARREILLLAADAGVAPRVIHTDEARRAVLSVFVAGKPFPAAYLDPRTRQAAVTDLGRTLRRVHDLPVPAGTDSRDPREVLATTWSGLSETPGIPAFVGDAVRRVLDEPPPRGRRDAVLSHNDVNPGNLIYDGEQLLLVDWDAAGSNDPYYDLAAIAVFHRMDDETCRRLLSAHDGESVDEIPAYFAYTRRLIAVLCPVVGMGMQVSNGHAPARSAATETLESTLSLGEFYQKLRAGEVRLDSPDGGRAFGLALVKESFSL
jgi:aminoglycoside phosphotransferase (APT) family kinase protein